MFLIKLFLAHLLGDFVLQQHRWVKHKEKHVFKSIYLYIHTILHGVLTFTILGFNTKYILGIALITLTHGIIDGIKLLRPLKNKRQLFFIDQLLHLCILLCVAVYYDQISLDFKSLICPKSLLFVTAIVLLTSTASIVLKILFTKWSKQIRSISEKDASLEKAGMYIGMLERLFVFMFIVLNHWEAVGFLLAAKSIFRFGDLSKAKDRQLTEYVLIGTLLSFGIAMVLGVLYLKILPLI